MPAIAAQKTERKLRIQNALARNDVTGSMTQGGLRIVAEKDRGYCTRPPTNQGTRKADDPGEAETTLTIRWDRGGHTRKSVSLSDSVWPRILFGFMTCLRIRCSARLAG